MTIAGLRERAEKELGVALDQTMVARFEAYLTTLRDWNSRMNLTAIREPGNIALKHFFDSLTVLPYLPKSATRLIDVGAGAGFPGIPLKIARPGLELVLVDSVGKKVEFLKALVSSLHLSETEAVNARAEDLGRDPKHRESYDAVVARAVAPLPILIEYCLPLLKVGGTMIAQKAAGAAKAEGYEAAIRALGGRFVDVVDVSTADLPGRELVIIEKALATPDEYPRAVGVPSKLPLV